MQAGHWTEPKTGQMEKDAGSAASAFTPQMQAVAHAAAIARVQAVVRGVCTPHPSALQQLPEIVRQYKEDPRLFLQLVGTFDPALLLQVRVHACTRVFYTNRDTGCSASLLISAMEVLLLRVCKGPHT